MNYRLIAVVPRAQLPKNVSNILRTAAHMHISNPVLEMLRMTVLTWNRQVTFSQKRNTHVSVRGDYITVDFHVDDVIWNWLEGGTEVRHYSFGDDFLAKTKVGQLLPDFGNWVGKYYNPGQPGIDAREWWNLISEEMERQRNQIVDDIQAEVFRKSGLDQWRM